MSHDILDEDQPAGRPILGQVLFYFGVCLSGGGLAAGVGLALERGLDMIIVSIAGAFVAVGAILLIIALRVGNFEPISLSTKAGRAQLILLCSVIFGALLGFYFTANDRLLRWLDGTLPMTPTEGVVGLLILFGVLLPMNLYWSRTVDEHESAAANSAGLFALYVYFFVYLAWAIASFARFVPPVDDAVLFLITLFAFGVVWVVKRAG